jgi:N-6 DNA Methylase
VRGAVVQHQLGGLDTQELTKGFVEGIGVQPRIEPRQSIAQPAFEDDLAIVLTLSGGLAWRNLGAVGDRKNHKFRDRRGEVLFIDARKMGFMVDRTHRDLSDADIARITGMYHLWRGETDVPPEAVEGRTEYEDIPGFCMAASLADIRKHGHVLTPGRYVGAEATEEDDEPFAEKMARLVADLHAQQGEAVRLDAAIAANLRELGYGG